MPRAFRTHTRGALPRPDGHGRRLQGGAMVESRCSSIPGPEPTPACRRPDPTMPKPPPRVSCASHGPALPTVSARAAAASNRRTHTGTDHETSGRPRWEFRSIHQLSPPTNPEGGVVAADLPAAAAVGAGETAVSTAATSCAMLPASAPSVGFDVALDRPRSSWCGWRVCGDPGRET
jgi:hypothetical protein